MDTVITVREVGIDWITATANGLGAAESMACLCERIVRDQQSLGYTTGPWSQYGYTGETINGCSWGRRKHETLIRLSGFVAEYRFDEVAKHADNVSRLDMAVTVRTEPMLENVARDAYRRLLAVGPGGRKGATASYITNSGGGSTCYLGRRSSDKFLRLYDKQRESGDEWYAGCWRYELEVKNEPALRLFRALGVATDRQRAIRDSVYGYCAEHGVPTLYDEGTEGVLLDAPRPTVDFDKQCQWLSNQVSGTAREVATTIGVGGLLRLLDIDVDASEYRSKRPYKPHGNHTIDDGYVNLESK